MNVWRDLGVTYFQIPDCIVSGDTLAMLKGSSLRLYLLILSRAQRKSSPTVELTVPEITEATGVNRRFVDAAAQELREFRLADMIRHKGGQRWSYEFHLIDPQTSLPLPSMYERTLSADNLSKSQMQSYFLHHLGQNFDHFDENGIMGICPFHATVKPKPTLSIMIGLTSSTWKCFEPECIHHGGGSIIDFEMAMQGLKDGKKITGLNAWRKIVHIIRAAERREAMQEDAANYVFDIQACAAPRTWDVIGAVSDRCYIM